MIMSKETSEINRRTSATASHGETQHLPAISLLGDKDFYLFNEGSHTRLYDKFGAHLMRVDGQEGTYFAVWAPNAERVFVSGSFNDWSQQSHPLTPK